MIHNKLISNQNGQGLVEYLILVALLAVASIGVTRVLGEQIKKKYTQIAYAISGKEQKFETPKISKTVYQKSDLSNFMQGSAKAEKSSRK